MIPASNSGKEDENESYLTKVYKVISVFLPVPQFVHSFVGVFPQVDS